MERFIKIIWIILILVIPPFMKVFAIDFNTPADSPTLMALIDAHKHMKNAELQALVQIEANVVEQNLITKTTKLYNDTKSVLNSKMSDANSYLLLASSIVQVSLTLDKVIKEYKNFTTNSVKYVSSSPLTSAYYANANYQIAKEVKHATKLIGSYSAAGFNILKASNDEKIKMIFLIKMSLSQIRDIIYHADIMMRTLIRTGYHVMYISDILTDDLLRDISNSLTKDWTQQCD